MGAWGPALYSDDLACDIRDDFKELIGDGLDSDEATKLLEKEYQDSLKDVDEYPVFWLALADTQWKSGRTIERVKNQAIKIIDNDSDLDRWKEDNKNLKKREKTLQKLKDQLLSPQPKEKKIVKTYKEESKFNVGDIFSYKNKLEKTALFRVIGIHQDKGGRFPVCEILDWFEIELPIKRGIIFKGKVDIKKILSLKNRTFKVNEKQLPQFMLGETLAKYKPKDGSIKLIGTKSNSLQTCGGYSIIFWRDLDEHIMNEFEK